MDPDPDPGGTKTYGSDGSRSATLKIAIKYSCALSSMYITSQWLPVVARDEWRDDEIRGWSMSEYLEVLVQIVPPDLQVAVPPRDRRVRDRSR